MATTAATLLYQEVRANVEQAFPGSIVSVTLPPHSSSVLGARIQPRRVIVTEKYNDQDEEAFAKRHLASEGSVYFRQYHDYPRSFLWRILDNRRLLEIQSADLQHDFQDQFEANLTFLFQFPSPIRPFGVAFADAQDRDTLTVFVITSANEIYTISLHRDFFARAAASELEIGEWCKVFVPSQFSLRVPYRLIAASVNKLLVSLDDGSILQLERAGSNETLWTERFYKQTSWSPWALVPWKGHATVRFNNTDLAGEAAAGLALSPDGQHILTVCLNHRLRAWNVDTGKAGVHIDILGEQDEPNGNGKAQPYYVGPSQTSLMAVLDISGGADGALYHIVTYSPKHHQFKVWGIRDADSPENGVFDAFPGAELIPPVDDLMNTTVWNLEEFVFNPGPSGWRGVELWIRARSGPSSKVYSLKFDLTDDASRVAHAWKHNWVGVDEGSLTVDGLKKNPTNPAEQDLDSLESFDPDVTEQWLDFLFCPGRFTIATLETALVLYRRGLGQRRAAQLSTKASLKERICVSVSAYATVAENGAIDHDEYEDVIHARWQDYYRLVKDLHKRRGESLSLAFDHSLDAPWLVLSDYLSAIRKCSEPELIALNANALATTSLQSRTMTTLRKSLPSLSKAGSQHVGKLLNAAAAFRRSLPTSVRRQLQRQVDNEVLHTQSISVEDRMQSLEQGCDLCRQVSDDDLAALVDDLGMNVKELTNELFLRAITLLEPDEHGRSNRKKQVTRFGLSSLMRVSQEALETNYNILLDLLVLVLFMQIDLDEEEVSEEFEASTIFVELMNQLKDHILLMWMASRVWEHPSPTGPSSQALLKSLSEKFNNTKKLPFTQTVLEGIYGHRVFDTAIPPRLGTDLLTYWARVWIAEPFKDYNFDFVADSIMMILLVSREYELAEEFKIFLSESTWSTYLKGRLYVVQGEYELASICFKKPAYNLGIGFFSLDDHDSQDFIPIDQRNSFSGGLSMYYHHVLGLFEKVRAHSFVSDFAKLALGCLSGTEGDELRTDVLSRLFSASLHTSRFDEAYSALVRHTDVALQKSSLQRLVTAMIEQSQAQALLRFPFVELTEDVDAILATKCHEQLNLAGQPYHQILYSFRISRNDYRGAAAILYHRLQRLKSTSSKVHDPEDESLARCYLMIINTLSSVSEDERYILAEQRLEDLPKEQQQIGRAKKLLKRQIITLDTLRKDYQKLLDDQAVIENAQFPFLPTDGDDAMEGVL